MKSIFVYSTSFVATAVIGFYSSQVLGAGVGTGMSQGFGKVSKKVYEMVTSKSGKEFAESTGQDVAGGELVNAGEDMADSVNRAMDKNQREINRAKKFVKKEKCRQGDPGQRARCEKDLRQAKKIIKKAEKDNKTLQSSLGPIGTYIRDTMAGTSGVLAGTAAGVIATPYTTPMGGWAAGTATGYAVERTVSWATEGLMRWGGFTYGVSEKHLSVSDGLPFSQDDQSLFAENQTRGLASVSLTLSGDSLALNDDSRGGVTICPDNLPQEELKTCRDEVIRKFLALCQLRKSEAPIEMKRDCNAFKENLNGLTGLAEQEQRKDYLDELVSGGVRNGNM